MDGVNADPIFGKDEKLSGLTFTFLNLSPDQLTLTDYKRSLIESNYQSKIEK